MTNREIYDEFSKLFSPDGPLEYRRAQVAPTRDEFWALRESLCKIMESLRIDGTTPPREPEPVLPGIRVVYIPEGATVTMFVQGVAMPEGGDL